jgi:hypothetical protein
MLRLSTPRSRNLAHQPVQAYCFSHDRWVALVCDRRAIDQREGAERRHCLVEAVAGERRSEGLAEFFAGLGKQE